MRRLLRWAFNLSALVSALMFVGVCVLWARCYTTAYYPSYLHWGSSHRVRIATQVQLSASRGRVIAEVSRVWLYDDVLAKSGWDVGGIVCLRDPATEVASPQRPGWTWQREDLATLRSPAADPGLGFYWNHLRDTNPSYGWYSVTWVAAPCWSLALLFAVLPAFRAAGLRRAARRSDRGLCRSCGYDLRATPGRCPECGAVPKAEKSA